MDTHTSTTTEDAAAASASHDDQSPSTMEGGDQGATSGPEVPTRASTCCHQCVVSQTVEPPATRAPSTPPIGHTEPRAPATTLESASTTALTAAEFYAHMLTIMADFSNTISEKLGQTIDANRELSQESTKLIRDEIQTMSKGLKADAKSNRNELSKGLVDLSQSISREIAVAITATLEHSNSLNQALLQTIIDLLQNRTNVQVGNNPNATSSYTTSNAENYPESGIPPGSQLNKGKGPEVPNEPPSMSHARVLSDGSGPPTPGPSKWPKTLTPTQQPPTPNPFTTYTSPEPPNSGHGGGGGGRNGGPGGPPRRDELSDEDDKDDKEPPTNGESMPKVLETTTNRLPRPKTYRHT
jgi:hypothetical protein